MGLRRLHRVSLKSETTAQNAGRKLQKNAAATDPSGKKPQSIQCSVKGKHFQRPNCQCDQRLMERFQITGVSKG